MLRVIALTTGPREEPCSRLRVYSVAELLRTQGHEVAVAPFMNERLYRGKNRSGLAHGVAKVAGVFSALARRTAVATGLLSRRWDVLIVQKESLPWGPPILERLAAHSGTRLVFDIDDGVMVPGRAGRWRNLWWDPSRVPTIMRLADAVIVGSHALEEYALQYSKRVVRIPTGVPDNQFVEAHTLVGGLRGDGPVVGWIGTRGNLEFLIDLLPCLQEVNQRTPFTLLVVGEQNIFDCDFGSLSVERVPWTLADESNLLQRMDIGLMPLPDEEWTQYKCGYKMLQYMAAGAVALASPVGENRLIVTHGVDGLLCATPSDWIESLGRVLEDGALRSRLATAARDTAAPYAMSAIAHRVARVVDGASRATTDDIV